MAQAIRDYPESNAVIVRRHGIYVWGATWQQAKSQAECIDYLCETAVEMKKLGVPISGGSTEVWRKEAYSEWAIHLLKEESRYKSLSFQNQAYFKK